MKILKTMINKTLVFVLMAFAVPVLANELTVTIDFIAEGGTVRVQLLDPSRNVEYDSYYAPDGPPSQGWSFKHTREVAGSYTVRIVSPYQYDCAPVIPEGESESFLAIDNYTKNCVVSFPAPKVQSFNFFVRGLADQGTQNFEVYSYDKANVEEFIKNYEIAEDHWLADGQSNPEKDTITFEPTHEYAVIHYNNGVCKDEDGNEKIHGTATQDIVLDFKAGDNCLITTDFVPTELAKLTMRFFLFGVSESEPVNFTLQQYSSNAHLKDIPYPFTQSGWPISPSTEQEMELTYDHAVIAADVNGSPTTCTFTGGESLIRLSKVDIVIDASRSDQCALYESFAGPQPGEPEPPVDDIYLDIDFYAQNAIGAKLYVREYDQSGKINASSVAVTLDRDYVDEPVDLEPFKMVEPENYDYAILEVHIDGAGRDCKFEDGSFAIKDIEKVYANFYYNPTSGMTSCLLYETTIQPQLEATFNLQGISQAAVEFYNVLAKEQVLTYSDYISNNQLVSLDRSIFGEYSVIKFVPPGLQKSQQGIVCKYNSGSEKVAPTTNEVTVIIDQNNQQCILQ